MSPNTALALVGAIAMALSHIALVTASGPHCVLSYEKRTRISNSGLFLIDGVDCEKSEGWTDCCMAPFSNYDGNHPLAQHYQAICESEPTIDKDCVKL